MGSLSAYKSTKTQDNLNSCMPTRPGQKQTHHPIPKRTTQAKNHTTLHQLQATPSSNASYSSSLISTPSLSSPSSSLVSS